MNSTFYSDVRHFIPKPKWSALTEDALKSYHDAINQSLNNVDISKDLVDRRNVDCTVHKSMIASLCNKIIDILPAAAKHAILFTSPKSHYNKSQPGWNVHVSAFKDEAINWHVIWKMSGSPPEGYVFEMRKASRAEYHKQINFMHNHREEIRAKNTATLFLNKDFNAYYHSVNLLKGKDKNFCPVSDGHKEIADCFAESYKTVFNDVGYDKAAMSELLRDIIDEISGNCVCSTSCGSHVISRDGIVNSAKQMRPGKNDGFDGLSSDCILSAPMSLFEILSVLFTCMLHHSYSPDSFCL